jgi:hypothetical protein
MSRPKPRFAINPDEFNSRNFGFNPTQQQAFKPLSESYSRRVNEEENYPQQRLQFKSRFGTIPKESAFESVVERVNEAEKYPLQRSQFKSRFGTIPKQSALASVVERVNEAEKYPLQRPQFKSRSGTRPKELAFESVVKSVTAKKSSIFNNNNNVPNHYIGVAPYPITQNSYKNKVSENITSIKKNIKEKGILVENLKKEFNKHLEEKCGISDFNTYKETVNKRFEDIKEALEEFVHGETEGLNEKLTLKITNLEKQIESLRSLVEPSSVRSSSKISIPEQNPSTAVAVAVAVGVNDTNATIKEINRIDYNSMNGKERIRIVDNIIKSYYQKINKLTKNLENSPEDSEVIKKELDELYKSKDMIILKIIKKMKTAFNNDKLTVGEKRSLIKYCKLYGKILEEKLKTIDNVSSEEYTNLNTKIDQLLQLIENLEKQI